MFNRTRIPFWRRKNSRTTGICNGPKKCVNSWALYDVEGSEVDAIRRFYEAFCNKSRCRGCDGRDLDIGSERVCGELILSCRWRTRVRAGLLELWRLRRPLCATNGLLRAASKLLLWGAVLLPAAGSGLRSIPPLASE